MSPVDETVMGFLCNLAWVGFGKWRGQGVVVVRIKSKDSDNGRRGPHSRHSWPVSNNHPRSR